MKPLSHYLIAATFGTLVSTAVVFGADAPVQPGLNSSMSVDPSKAPKGLSDTDWSGIRGAYEGGRHAIVANSDGTHQARNPGQAWLTRFDARGFIVTPDVGGWSWGLELAGYGEVTDVRHDGGRISYVRGDGLTEWFLNDGRGLEQGWTLENRPARAGLSGPVRLNLSVRGGLRPQIAAEGGSVAFLNETGGAALTYGGLKAWDANGKILQVRFVEGEARAAGISVLVNDAEASYPITVDPIAQQAYLKASNTEAGDGFGESVSVFGDTVVVGSPREDSSATGVNGNQTDNSASNSGAAYVFIRSGTTWTQEAYLKASNTGSGDGFGGSIAVSGDTVVIGAPSQGAYGSYSNNTTGGSYVFVRNGSNWSQQAFFKESNNGPIAYFGNSVAISGNTVVVGAHYQSSDAGAAYVYVRSGTTWSRQAYLTASNPVTHDVFGSSVSISGDTIVIGAPGEDGIASGAGAAYVFVRNGTAWDQQAYLKASNAGAWDFFGWSAAVSGETIVIGAPAEESSTTGVNGDQFDNSAGSSGAAYVFIRSGTTWTQQAYLKASNTGPGKSFGTSISVFGDTVVVGAPTESSSATGANGNQSDNSASGAGAAYVFMRSGTTWSQRAYLKASNTEAGDSFGKSVSVFGETVVVGTPGEDSSATGVNGNQIGNTAAESGAAFGFIVPTKYALLASAVHGSIGGAGDFEAGNTATLTATPSPGYIFTGWTGDATGSDNPLSVLMTADKTISASFTPDTNDTDDDGFTNYEEIVIHGTNPALRDTDGDTVKDSTDAFPLDPAETLDTDDDSTGDNADTDDDGDGLSDTDEITIHGTNPKRADSDGDGLSDPAEIQTHLTNPNIADTDNDGLSDGAEVNTYGTLPKVGDSDDDGFLDGYEVFTGKLPLDRLSKPALVAEARTAIEFVFPAAIGKTYRIEDSTDLITWGTVESGIIGTGGQIQRFYSILNVPKRYFRVEEDTP